MPNPKEKVEKPKPIIRIAIPLNNFTFIAIAAFRTDGPAVTFGNIFSDSALGLVNFTTF